MTSTKLDYIDALRGWAVLLVITSHVSGPITELPYPLRKLTNYGWYGVQLFFLASAITLLLSWQADQRALSVKTREFFIRRFFRIAPLYYAGALLYFWLMPPPPDWTWSQMWTTLTFVNSWTPTWLPTTPGWTVVPGGWSISVEFTFYALFPLLALMFASPMRAVAFLLFSWGLATQLNPWVASSMAAQHGELATHNFLYFWLPNQLPVFAIGFVTYFALSKIKAHLVPANLLYAAMLGLLGVMLWLSQRPPVHPHYLHSVQTQTPMFLAAISFAVFIWLMSSARLTLLCSAWIRRIGVLSFSMYMLHIAAIHVCAPWVLKWFHQPPEGLSAVGAFVALWLSVLALTYCGATLTHRYIEEAGSQLAKTIISRMRN